MKNHGSSTPPRVHLNGSAGAGLAGVNGGGEDSVPRLWGIPLKYISLVTLAVQNAALAIVMHYSRVSTTPSRAYSAATAVLMNELLKGSISLAIAYSRVDEYTTRMQQPAPRNGSLQIQSGPWYSLPVLVSRCRRLAKEVFSPDCWKLSIPAILYVIQNNLQFVAASNLEAATFQVTYQMKILTTAAFSVLLLRKRLNTSKWLALLGLAIGVGIVQIQTGSGTAHNDAHMHVMHPLKGFLAVVAACFTSGLAGVYFEMVLKGSQADLWVRNTQLSLFSLVPALVPVIASQSNAGTSGSIFRSLFANFGAWAWATVAIQVFGGLVTAVVIKYSDNILKGFATSLSIVLSFLASVGLFNFHITPAFLVGATIVLCATGMYNRPDIQGINDGGSASSAFPKLVAGIMAPRKSSYPNSPVESDAPILGEPDERCRNSLTLGGASPSMLAAALKLVTPRSSQENLAGHNETLDETIYSLNRNPSASNLNRSVSGLGPYSHSSSQVPSPYISRSHSPVPGLSPSMPLSRLHSQQSSSSASTRLSTGPLHLHPDTADSNRSVISLDENSFPSQ